MRKVFLFLLLYSGAYLCVLPSSGAAQGTSLPPAIPDTTDEALFAQLRACKTDTVVAKLHVPLITNTPGRQRRSAAHIALADTLALRCAETQARRALARMRSSKSAAERREAALLFDDNAQIARRPLRYFGPTNEELTFTEAVVRVAQDEGMIKRASSRAVKLRTRQTPRRQ